MSTNCRVPVAKICGLRDAGAARVAIQGGAWALGFILAPSRRQIAPQEIRSIRAELSRDHAVIPPMVGVTVNATESEISDMIEVAGFDMIQLSGDEKPSVMEAIDIPVIKSLRFEAGISTDAARRELFLWTSGRRQVDYVHVEGHAVGSYGGTGTLADWALAEKLAEEYPIILSGGLTPDNVSSAVQHVQPFAVDVSSGVEMDGVKDPARIRAFLAAVHV